MKLAELKAAGGFVPSVPVAKEVTWKREGHDDVAFTVHIKRQSFGSIERLLVADDSDRSRSAAYLAECVLLGDPPKLTALSYEDAYALEPTLARVLIDAINAVNGTGSDPKN
jgi:hypothetical protein